MLIIFDVIVHGPNTRVVLRRDFNSPYAAPPGVEIEDPAWKGAKKPAAITWNPTSGFVHYSFGLDEHSDNESAKAVEDTYQLHGWKKL